MNPSPSASRIREAPRNGGFPTIKSACDHSARRGLVHSQSREQVADLGFEAFEEFEGNVEEVARAAGVVKDAEFAEFVVERGYGLAGCFGVAGFVELGGGSFDSIPLFAEGLDDGWADEALHGAARGVVRTGLVALAGVESLFKQGAENPP